MRVLSDWLVKFGAAGLILMTAIIGWQVFGRFVLNSSPSWSEQGSMVLMIWYVFFAAAAGFREGFHIRIGLLEDSISDAAAQRVRLVINIVVALFGLVLLAYGTQLVWLVWEFVIPSLGVSRGIAYLPIPFCGLLIILFAVNNFLTELRGEKVQAD
ncbi:TRAP transporter small permease [Pontixanthobacter sp. CEM42]|uniref:TRAP transporter small permease n=1 Tax=Pontixanthobacter sp. CEM42 TaxID=2792077 RepID=UPI001AE09494|nr:TRAP transporter small permease [Pontixanthobacter sp. CEM42]